MSKYLLSFLFVHFLITLNIFSQTVYIRTTKLPWDGYKLLNKEFEKWDYFNSPIPYFDSTGTMTAWEYADLIKGDFNSDSKDDFAILVKPYNTNDGFLVVLMKTDNSYELLKLDKVLYVKDMVLFLKKGGSKAYDFDTESYFDVPSDGITLAFYEKGGQTYYMVDGKFNVKITSD